MEKILFLFLLAASCPGSWSRLVGRDSIFNPLDDGSSHHSVQLTHEKSFAYPLPSVCDEHTELCGPLSSVMPLGKSDPTSGDNLLVGGVNGLLVLEDGEPSVVLFEGCPTTSRKLSPIAVENGFGILGIVGDSNFCSCPNQPCQFQVKIQDILTNQTECKNASTGTIGTKIESGTNIIGTIWYEEAVDWCEPQEISIDFTQMVLTDRSKCQISQQVLNIWGSGAGAALIIDFKNNVLLPSLHTPSDPRITIPSVIFDAQTGSEIKGMIQNYGDGLLFHLNGKSFVASNSFFTGPEGLRYFEIGEGQYFEEAVDPSLFRTARGIANGHTPSIAFVCGTDRASGVTSFSLKLGQLGVWNEDYITDIQFSKHGSRDVLFASAGFSSKLYAIDVSDPGQMKTISSMELLGQPVLSQPQGNLLYLLVEGRGTGAISVISYSDLSAPEELSSLPAKGATTLHVQSDLMWIGYLNGNISVFNLSKSPEDPQLITAWKSPKSQMIRAISSVILSEDLTKAYAVDSSGLLMIFRLTKEGVVAGPTVIIILVLAVTVTLVAIGGTMKMKAEKKKKKKKKMAKEKEKQMELGLLADEAEGDFQEAHAEKEAIGDPSQTQGFESADEHLESEIVIDEEK